MRNPMAQMLIENPAVEFLPTLNTPSSFTYYYFRFNIELKMQLPSSHSHYSHIYLQISQSHML